MNPRKLHTSPWILLGFTVLLVLGCVLAAVGISYARFRTEESGGIHFNPDEVAHVCLGSITAEGFKNQQSQWVVKDDKLQLSFAISNSESFETFPVSNQKVRVRIVASLGAWNETAQEAIVLSGAGTEYTAVVERITSGSILYAQFGDGWLFRFVDESGGELEWELDGGRFSCIEMLLTISTTAITDTSLLQLQIVAD